MSTVHYNPKPLRNMLRRAASRRIDIAGIWNSEGTFASWGIESGLFLALWRRYQCYGTSALSFGASQDDDNAVDGHLGPNWSSTTGDQYYRNFGNGTTWTQTKSYRASAPAANRTHFDITTQPAGKWGPHYPLYNGGTITGWVNFENYRYSVRANPIPIEESLTATFWGVEFTTSGGSVVGVFRTNAGVTVHNFGTVSYAGTDGLVKKSEATIAADSGRTVNTSMQMHFTTFGTNIFLTWMRMARAAQTSGFAVHPFYCKGSQSIYDMWECLTTLPATSWYHYFNVLTNYQGADVANHCAIFDIYEGSNFAGESSVSGSAPQPGDADHPDNYLWYVQQIVTHIEGLWILSGRSLDNIAFRVRASHPINSGPTEAEVETFREKLRTMDFAAYPRVTVCDMKALAPLEEMVAAGDFFDATHLSYTGYVRTEEKAMRDLMQATTWRAGRSRSRPLGSVR
jgi:hypothetical protein